MIFLPEDDQEYLESKGLVYEFKSESIPDGTARRGIVFPGFEFASALNQAGADGKLVPRTTCDLLILIPSGYATTKLDSFYTSPHLKRADGSDPPMATGDQVLFGETWQFWSRHLADQEWRAGVDGMETYLQYVRSELRKA